MNIEIFGRKTKEGIALFHSQDGESVTRMDANVYPIGSTLSARYEHPEGIVISVEDAEKLKIEIEV